MPDIDQSDYGPGNCAPTAALMALEGALPFAQRPHTIGSSFTGSTFKEFFKFEDTGKLALWATKMREPGAASREMTPIQQISGYNSAIGGTPLYLDPNSGISNAITGRAPDFRGQGILSGWYPDIRSPRYFAPLLNPQTKSALTLALVFAKPIVEEHPLGLRLIRFETKAGHAVAVKGYDEKTLKINTWEMTLSTYIHSASTAQNVQIAWPVDWRDAIDHGPNNMSYFQAYTDVSDPMIANKIRRLFPVPATVTIFPGNNARASYLSGTQTPGLFLRNTKHWFISQLQGAVVSSTGAATPESFDLGSNLFGGWSATNHYDSASIEVSGYACENSRFESLTVDVYAGGVPGVGQHIRSIVANKNANLIRNFIPGLIDNLNFVTPIANECGTSSMNYSFQERIPFSEIDSAGDKKLYFVAKSVTGERTHVLNQRDVNIYYTNENNVDQRMQAHREEMTRRSAVAAVQGPVIGQVLQVGFMNSSPGSSYTFIGIEGWGCAVGTNIADYTVTVGAPFPAGQVIPVRAIYRAYPSTQTEYTACNLNPQNFPNLHFRLEIAPEELDRHRGKQVYVNASAPYKMIETTLAGNFVLPDRFGIVPQNMQSSLNVDPNNGGSYGLESTNNMFGNSGWSQAGDYSGLSVVTDELPSGQKGQVDRLFAPVGKTGAHYYRTVQKPAEAMDMTFSVFAKPLGRNKLMLAMGDGPLQSQVCTVSFDLLTQTVTAKTCAGAWTLKGVKIAPAENGWTYLSLSVTTGTEDHIRYQLNLLDPEVGDGQTGILATRYSLSKGVIYDTQGDGPLLALDFSDEVLDSEISFSRNSTASYFNKQGLLVTAAANQPRFEYDPSACSGGTCAFRGLLIESARTNLAKYSGDVGNSAGAWSFDSASTGVLTNSMLAPDGQTAAEVVYRKTPSLTANVAQIIGKDSTVRTYTISAFIKSKNLPTGHFVRILLGDHTWTNRGYGDFDANTGATLGMGPVTGNPAVGVWTPLSSGTQAVGNGWYRVWVVIQSPASSELRAMVALANENETAFDGSKGFAVWGVQVEEGAFPTSLIATTNSTATRVVDNASIQNFRGIFDKGTLMASFSVPSLYTTAQRMAVSLNTTGLANPRSLRAGWSQFGNRLEFYNHDYYGSAIHNQVYLSSVPLEPKRIYDVAYAFADNDAEMWVNGSKSNSSTTMLVPRELSQLNIGSRDNGIESLNGHIRKIAVWNTRIPSSELSRLTGGGKELDFSNEMLSPEISFTRPGAAFYHDSSGKLVSAATDQPRFEYDPSQCSENICTFKGLLIEGPSQNLLKYSARFEVAAFYHSEAPTVLYPVWTRNETTTGVMSNEFDTPERRGTNLADVLFRRTPQNASFIEQALTKDSNVRKYTFSVYFKNKGLESGGKARLLVGDNNSVNRAYADFDINTGAVSSSGVMTGNASLPLWTKIDAGSKSVGDGWHRGWIVVQTPATTDLKSTIALIDETPTAFNGTVGLALWGAQLEENAFPTSLIQTLWEPVNRPADRAYLKGNLLRGNQGTLITEYSVPTLFTSVHRHACALTDGPSTGPQHSLRAGWSGGNTNVMFYAYDASQPQSVMNSGISMTAGALTKAAISFIDGSFITAINGAAGPTVTGKIVPRNLNQIEIGSRHSGIEPLNGHIRRIRLLPDPQPAQVLQLMTAP